MFKVSLLDVLIYIYTVNSLQSSYIVTISFMIKTLKIYYLTKYPVYDTILLTISNQFLNPVLLNALVTFGRDVHSLLPDFLNNTLKVFFILHYVTF